MFGDLDDGVYAVMAYIVTDDPKSTFKGGCETIAMYSG
jgi:hypothetical protein